MTATINTEIYRPFRGRLSEHRLRFLPLSRSAIRTATKRKLPMLVLLAPPGIATVIFSFVVYARFAVESGVNPVAMGSAGPGAMLVAGFAEKLIQVREQIVMFHLAMSAFTLLVIAWYGAGEIAEDRRLGAHLLYFSRPLTLLDYLLGKLFTVAFFGSLVVLLPGLVICAVATFSSPDWAFLKREGDVIPRTIAFALLWIATWSSVILAISSLFSRKTFALVASFAFFMLQGAVATLLGKLLKDSRWHMLSLQGNFLRLAGWILDMPRLESAWGAGWSLAIVGAFTALAWLVLLLRVRRMEAVA